MSTSCNPGILNIINDPTANLFYSWVQQKQSEIDLLKNVQPLSPEQIDTLNSLNTEMQNTIDCLNEQNGLISAINTENALTRSDIASKKKELLTRQDDVKIAEDRALLVRNPELSSSYYDGWFSLNRPMHKISVPILIGFSVFFSSISIFMILKIINISVMFSVLVPQETKYQSRDTLFGLFKIVLGIALVLLILTIYAFTK